MAWMGFYANLLRRAVCWAVEKFLDNPELMASCAKEAGQKNIVNDKEIELLLNM